MKAYDFIYSEKKLSEFGFQICSFGSKGLETLDNGSQISFNKVSSLNGLKHNIVSTLYEDCLEATIQICKNSCSGNAMEISPTEEREIMRWLNRKGFYKFKILDDRSYDIFYEASFNVSRVEIDGVLYGFELAVTTNRPFALKELRTIRIKNTLHNGNYSINDTSYEEGYIYPHVEITINESGNLIIHNDLEDRDTYIANCEAGEVITMDYPVIKTSLSSHKIQNDFNWIFFRIANTYDNRRNDFTISIPCNIKIEYNPIVKVGI